MSHSKHANPPDTVRIGASRFEQSPYYDYYVNPETILGVAAGRFYPSYNGERLVAPPGERDRLRQIRQAR